jgi:hypothetical protein
MKPRSPVLGYNHNVRYAQRLWHVQTEDSGVSNPHIFTHLFHDGTILATKRIDYDPSSDVGVVQKLMQAQHKAMLRDLKQGAFDDKIARFFGAPVVREDQTDPGANREIPSGEFDLAPKTDPSIPPVASSGSSPNVPQQPPARVMTPAQQQMAHAPTQQAQPQPARPSTTQQPVTRPAQPRAPEPVAPSPSRPNLTPSRPAIPVAASRSGTVPSSAPRAPVTGVGGRRPQTGGAHSYGGGKPTAEGVVVARPAVIVGDPQGTAPRSGVGQRQRSFTPPPPHQNTTTPAPSPGPSKTPTSDNIFGGDLISEKSLDEVILAYLSEDLNEK